MSQELSDVERDERTALLRQLARARDQHGRSMMPGSGVAEAAMQEAIGIVEKFFADRLERPGVEVANRIQTLEHALEIVLERCPDEEPEGYDGMNPGDIRTDAVDQWTWEIGQRIRSLIR